MWRNCAAAQKKSNVQQEKFGFEILTQNDAFHKLNNSRKARKKKFQDQKMQSQKLFTKMEDLKLEGLKQLAKQMIVDFHLERNMSKT